ncbi:MAG TPA: protealysin inhibitor emfourin [Geobacteraceae bacterium]|nr:protealysin inhibitor emfourin [Geobacteraceae bacterium]
MRITFERTGGFAGITLSATLDTENLAADEANELLQCVERADFFNLPERIVSPSPRPDRFQYKVNVQDGRGRHTITVSEDIMPADLKPLIQWLSEAARRARKGGKD